MRFIQINQPLRGRAQRFGPVSPRAQYGRIISESYTTKDKAVWAIDKSGRCRNWTTERYLFEETTATPGIGFVRGKINGGRVSSCYVPQNTRSVKYERTSVRRKYMTPSAGGADIVGSLFFIGHCAYEYWKYLK